MTTIADRLKRPPHEYRAVRVLKTDVQWVLHLYPDAEFADPKLIGPELIEVRPHSYAAREEAYALGEELRKLIKASRKILGLSTWLLGGLIH